MASGVVCVRPGMLPATISVMPKSPRARQNASTVPAMTAREASGSVMDQNTLHWDRPSVSAACSSLLSTASKPACAALMKSALDPTHAASTAARHVKASSIPAASRTRPIAPWRLIRTRR
jgi:hypothetical protein